jgi:hypothetical protein
LIANYVLLAILLRLSDTVNRAATPLPSADATVYAATA